MKIEKKIIKVEGIRYSVISKGKEIGRAFLYILHNDIKGRDFGYIEDLHIDELYRGKGIGSNLIKLMIKDCKRQGGYKIELVTGYDNEGARKLYEKLGFRRLGTDYKMYLL
jgi:ribosomal protein S18 acetylase RimI-like enzyme